MSKEGEHFPSNDDKLVISVLTVFSLFVFGLSIAGSRENMETSFAALFVAFLISSVSSLLQSSKTNKEPDVFRGMVGLISVIFGFLLIFYLRPDFTGDNLSIYAGIAGTIFGIIIDRLLWK